MATHTLNILQPSVNNLTARIFLRAAGLDFEERNVWGKTREPDFLAKDPAHLTPMLEEEGLPRGTLWESCAIMAYLCNKHGLDRFYPADPGERAMVDSANFYLIGTLYPLVARATYPVLGFPPVARRNGRRWYSSSVAVPGSTSMITLPPRPPLPPSGPPSGLNFSR